MTDRPLIPRCGCSSSPPGSRRRWENAPLAREMFVISHLMTRCADRLVADLGLTCARWRLMGAVAGFEEPPTLSDLCGEALLSIQNVSRMIAAMEDDGLVERFTRSGMGRAVFVRATERGLAVLETARIRADRFNKAFLQGVDKDEIVHLQDRIDRIIDNLENLECELSAENGCGTRQAGSDTGNGAAANEKGHGA